MQARRCFAVAVLIAFAWVQNSASAQAPTNRVSSIAPPIPTGPPLEVPASASLEQNSASAPTNLGTELQKRSSEPTLKQASSTNALPTWLEESEDFIPAGAMSAPNFSHWEIPPQPMRPRHPTPPPATFAGSSCDFNPWCGDNIFSPDFHSYQVLGGYYASSSLGPDIPAFNFMPLTVRKGWMLTAPGVNDHIFQGNWECLAGLSIAAITSSYGHIAASPTVHLRRNYLALGDSIVPYTQLGVGFFVSDAHKDKTQRAIGQACEFTLQAQWGVRFFVTSEMSVDVEMGYQHISNLNQSGRNYGVNAFGAQAGITYHFPWGVK